MHACTYCGSDCHCCGDIEDHDTGEEYLDDCYGCGCPEDEDDWDECDDWNEDDDRDVDDGWDDNCDHGDEYEAAMQAYDCEGVLTRYWSGFRGVRIPTERLSIDPEWPCVF